MGKSKEPEPAPKDPEEDQWEFKTPYKPFILPEFAEKKSRKLKKGRRRYTNDSYADEEFDENGNRTEPYDMYKDPSVDKTDLFLKPSPASNVNVVAITCTNAIESANSTHLGWAGRVEHSIGMTEAAIAKQLAFDNMTTFIHDPNRLLEVSISTIILAALGEQISYEHLVFTSLYMRNIRDEHGDHPPNISNFIHYLNYLRRSQHGDRTKDDDVVEDCSSQKNDDSYVNNEMLQQYTTEPDSQTTVTKYVYRKKRPRKVIFCDELDQTPDGSDKDRSSRRRNKTNRDDYRYNRKDPRYQPQNDSSYRSNSLYYSPESRSCTSRFDDDDSIYETPRSANRTKSDTLDEVYRTPKTIIEKEVQPAVDKYNNAKKKLTFEEEKYYTPQKGSEKPSTPAKGSQPRERQQTRPPVADKSKQQNKTATSGNEQFYTPKADKNKGSQKTPATSGNEQFYTPKADKNKGSQKTPPPAKGGQPKERQPTKPPVADKSKQENKKATSDKEQFHTPKSGKTPSPAKGGQPRGRQQAGKDIRTHSSPSILKSRQSSSSSSTEKHSEESSRNSSKESLYRQRSLSSSRVQSRQSTPNRPQSKQSSKAPQPENNDDVKEPPPPPPKPRWTP